MSQCFKNTTSGLFSGLVFPPLDFAMLGHLVFKTQIYRDVQGKNVEYHAYENN